MENLIRTDITPSEPNQTLTLVQRKSMFVHVFESREFSRDIELSNITSGGRRYSLCIARSQAALIAAFKLRYQVYVEEMGRPEPYCDHALKLIAEPLDIKGTILLLECNGVAIGTVRMNYNWLEDLPKNEMYDYGHFTSQGINKIALITKLMVAESFRRSIACTTLCKALYSEGLRVGAEIGLIDSNDHLVEMYSRFGFQKYGEKQVCKLYGDVTTMALYTQDLEHLVSVRSPFAGVLGAHRATQPKGRCETKQMSMYVH